MNGVDQGPNRPLVATYSITRPILQTTALHTSSGYARKPKKFSLAAKWRSLSFIALLHSLVPITEWLPRYDLKQNLVGDLISGFTVAVMHIPQGMAYGILALVTPEVGLYMAFFPVLVYFLLATSRHASLGTFAVISIMVSKTVQTHATFSSNGQIVADGAAVNGTAETLTAAGSVSPLEVITALSLMVGCIHLIMFACRLGTLSSLLSEPLVSGFTTGAAVHVFVNQLKDILGIQMARFRGPFKLVYSLMDLASKIGESNVTAIILSAILITAMVLNNELLKPRLAKVSKIPVPIELMAVIGGTLVSKYLHLNENFNVSLVGPIPTGLPEATVPRFDLLPRIATDAVAIAIVSYAVLMSVAKTFAKKHSYAVKANQELLATGLANVMGAFFSCMPTGCALARSVIQEQTGGKTQIASLVSASLILLVILFIGPFFEVLPRCVLSSIIVVALKAMLFQVFNVKRFYKQDRLDAATWIVTFLAVVIIDIDLGLLCGVATALICLYLRGLKAHACSLGNVPGTDLYVDLDSHAKAVKVAGVEIWQYSGSINFTSAAAVKKKFYEAIGVDLKELLRGRRRRTGTGKRIVEGVEVEEQVGDLKECEGLNGAAGGCRVAVFDVSAVPRMDFAACKVLLEIKGELARMGIDFLISGPNDRIFDMLRHVFMMQKEEISLFTSVHDAILWVESTKVEV